MKHTGTVEIQTKRLVLRKFKYEDIPDMLHNWIANPSIQTEYGEPVYESHEEVEELLNKWILRYKDDDFYRWAIILKDKNKNIGQIAFCRVYTEIETAEIEYCIGENYWGNGYALEGLNAIIEYSLKIPEFQKLEAYHRKENPQSGRVLEKTCMNRVPSIQRFQLQKINPKDEICYAIERSTYLTLV